VEPYRIEHKLIIGWFSRANPRFLAFTPKHAATSLQTTLACLRNSLFIKRIRFVNFLR